ncbi:MAG: metallophosphoesterase, partial [Planctomycetota bacterium]
MTSLPQLRLIHISDLHFGTNHICTSEDRSSARKGIPPLKKLLRRDLESLDWQSSVWAIQTRNLSPTPLLIAATGDLTQTADPNEFDQAYDFLHSLGGQPVLGSQIDFRHVFVVPGNHDVVFDKPNPEHRFAPYCQFYNKLFRAIQPAQRPYARPEEAHELNQIHAFPESRFLVAEVNSCYYVEKETIDESRGQVDLGAIAALRRALDAYGDESNQWIKIALVHHHPVLLPSFIEPGRGVDSVLNAKSLLRLLRDKRFQLVLHGHKHFPQVFSYDPDSAWATAEAAIPQLIVAGGSCGSRGLPEGTRKCNTYNLITAKWNPKALQARVQVVTRGLTRTGPDADLDPDQWAWKTLRTFDKILSPYENLPLARSAKRVPFPKDGDPLEGARDAQYQAFRFNMPVVEVLPSLMPGQGYEARAWLVPHRYHKEFPIRVVWSAGRMFDRKVLEVEAAPDFAVSFHYWGPMLIQAELEFNDG